MRNCSRAHPKAVGTVSPGRHGCCAQLTAATVGPSYLPRLAATGESSGAPPSDGRDQSASPSAGALHSAVAWNVSSGRERGVSTHNRIVDYLGAALSKLWTALCWCCGVGVDVGAVVLVLVVVVATALTEIARGHPRRRRPSHDPTEASPAAWPKTQTRDSTQRKHGGLMSQNGCWTAPGPSGGGRACDHWPAPAAVARPAPCQNRCFNQLSDQRCPLRAVGLSGLGGIIGRFSRGYRGFELKNPIIALPYVRTVC